jgi:N-acetyl-gamma-glutamyl-phosphate reductase
MISSCTWIQVSKFQTAQWLKEKKNSVGTSANWTLPLLQDLPDMVAVKDADFSKVDAVFCCLPHGTTQVRS